VALGFENEVMAGGGEEAASEEPWIARYSGASSPKRGWLAHRRQNPQPMGHHKR
jgi:hypothetical protein